MSVIVFGSINIDLVAHVPRLPVTGETLTGSNFTILPGGKGANQAVAVARLGVSTQIVGCVGKDVFGQTVLQSLETYGVDNRLVRVDETAHTGVALVTVDDQGNNQIIVIPGTNGLLNEVDVERLQDLLPEAGILMLQLEIPLFTVVAAAKAAKQAGLLVMLDPAPARTDLPDELYPFIDILTPNQVEASQLVGFPVDEVETAKKAAFVLRQRGVDTVIVKLGRLGALCMTPEDTIHIPAFPVEVADTVAAGDAFNSGLAAALAASVPFSQALVQASAVAALCVTKAGAQSSMPSREELHVFLRESEPLSF
jgi:ribokinase